MRRGMPESDVSPTSRKYSRISCSKRSRALPVKDLARASLLDDGDDRLTHQRLEQRFFVLEVEVDRALGNAGAAGDILELRGSEPAVGKDFKRRRDDLFRTGVLAPAPTGFCDCVRHCELQSY